MYQVILVKVNSFSSISYLIRYHGNFAIKDELRGVLLRSFFECIASARCSKGERILVPRTYWMCTSL